MNQKFETLPVLLAEDNDDDVFILRRAVKQAGVNNPLHVVVDGQETLDYLSGAGKFADRAAYPLPHVLLLDLKLPLRPGLEILAWIRGQPALRSLTVVVLTSSAEQRDLKGARELGARFYLVKPPKPKTLADMMAMFRAEWESSGASAAARLDGDLFSAATLAEGQ
jgi:CheY-like chemotaxis protein